MVSDQAPVAQVGNLRERIKVAAWLDVVVEGV